MFGRNKKVPAQIHRGSQLHVLRQNLIDAGARHGETVRATIGGVGTHTGDLYFCDSDVQVHEHIAGVGDKSDLPYSVAPLEDFQVPKRARWVRFENVIIETNGTIRLKKDEQTRVLVEA